MINLQEYIDEKLDAMDYEFRISQVHMSAESDIVRNFVDEVFDGTSTSFVTCQYTDFQDFFDVINVFSDGRADISYDALMDWFNSPSHDGVYHFENVIKEGLVSTDANFDFYHTIQVAQIDEAIDAITFAYDSEVLTPVIAATFMQSNGYEKANEELLDKMGELMNDNIYAYEISNNGLERVLNNAKEELGLTDKEVGEKSTEKDKDKGQER